MKTEKLSGTMSNAHGDSISNLSGGKLKEVPYEGEVNLFETPQETKDAGEWPSEADIVSFVNQARKANKRQALMSAALEAAGIKKPTLEDPRVQFSQIVKALVASGKSEAEAAAIANSTLGTSF